MTDTDKAIEELQALRHKVEEFRVTGTVVPEVATIIVMALNHAIDLLIPF